MIEYLAAIKMNYMKHKNNLMKEFLLAEINELVVLELLKISSPLLCILSPLISKDWLLLLLLICNFYRITLSKILEISTKIVKMKDANRESHSLLSMIFTF